MTTTFISLAYKVHGLAYWKVKQTSTTTLTENILIKTEGKLKKEEKIKTKYMYKRHILMVLTVKLTYPSTYLLALLVK